jgi:hypothetical protein
VHTSKRTHERLDRLSESGRRTLPAEEPVAPRIRAMRLGDSHVTA